jgi:predicted transcriptional regulator
MRKYDIFQLPLIDGGVQVGSIREISIMKRLVCKEVWCTQKVRDVMDEQFPTVETTDNILNPLTLLKDRNAVLVLDNNQIADIITTIDVIDYLMETGAVT